MRLIYNKNETARNVNALRAVEKNGERIAYLACATREGCCRLGVTSAVTPKAFQTSHARCNLRGRSALFPARPVGYESVPSLSKNDETMIALPGGSLGLILAETLALINP